MSTVSCPQCNQQSPFGVSFCGNCGFNIVAITGNGNCNTCGEELPPSAKFCGGCGSSVKPTAGISGSVVNGEWQRGDGEFVKRISPEEMKSNWGGKSIKVPNGTVCVVLKDGKVDTIHQPGHKVAIDVFENFFSWFSGGIDASFYLIDCSPIPFATRLVRTTGNREQQVSVRMQAFLIQPSNQKAQIMQFITKMVKDKGSVTTQDVYNLISKEVIATAKHILSKASDDFFQAEKRIAQELNREIGALYGLHFVATVSSSASMYTVNAHLGRNQVPETVKCVKCHVDTPLTRPFCGGCGQKQPFRHGNDKVGEQLPLITSDDRQVELDVVFQLQGYGDFGQNDSLIPALASAAAGAVRLMTADEAISADGVRKIQDQIRKKLMEQITGFQLKHVAVLDVKDKSGQWLLNARIGVQREMDKLKVNQEWMKVEEAEFQFENQREEVRLNHESQRLDLEKMAMDIVLQRQSLQLDQEFERIQIEQADELRRLQNAQEHEVRTTDLNYAHEQRMQDSTLNHTMAMDERELRDAQNRVAMEDARADIDLHNTNRNVNTAIGKDEAGRRLNRHVDEQDHIDNRTQYARNREIIEQERADQFADDKVNLQHGQDIENMQFAHELQKERETVDHNIWIKDQQVDSTIRTNEKMADSDNRIHLNQAKTQDEIDWMKAQTADKTRRMDIETQLFADKAHSDLAFEDDARRNAMDQGNLDAEQRREMEQLQAQAKIAQDLAAQKQQHELAMDAQRNQHEETMKGMDADVEKTRIAAEHDKDVAVSQAQLEAEREKAQRERELAAERSAMERQFREESAARADKQSDMMMAMMQNLTQGLAGMNQAQQQQQQATINAHKDAAAQARDMANASMHSMSNVAAAAAGNRPVGQSQQEQQSHGQQPQANQANSNPSANSNRRPMGFHPETQPHQEAATKASAKPTCVHCGSVNVSPKFCMDCGKPQ